MPESYYLAYGSNLHPLRLRERVPSCALLARVPLAGYRLVFHKKGMDGSGKADLLATGYPADQAWGALYSMHDDDRHALDVAEGPGYETVTMPVPLADRQVEALVYLARATHQDPAQVPFHWYKQLVLAGGRFLSLPPAYLQQIEAVPSRPDPEQDRSAANDSLLREMATFPPFDKK